MKYGLFLVLFFVFQTSAQILKASIISIGCKEIKASNVKPMKISQVEFEAWQKQTFEILSKQSFIAKCRAKDGLFYRVLFEEETFSNESIAAARLPKIRLLPPKEDDKSELAVPILLREGFQVKNKVYTIGSFANIVYLEGNVKIWRDRLQKKIR